MLDGIRNRAVEKCEADFPSRMEAADLLMKILEGRCVNRVRMRSDPRAYLLQFVRSESQRAAIDRVFGMWADRDETIQPQKSFEEVCASSPDYVFGRLVRGIVELIRVSDGVYIVELLSRINQFVDSIVAEFPQCKIDARGEMVKFGITKVLRDMTNRELLHGYSISSLLIMAYVRETAREALGVKAKG